MDDTAINDFMSGDDVLRGVETDISSTTGRPSRFVGKFKDLKESESYKKTKEEVTTGNFHDHNPEAPVSSTSGVSTSTTTPAVAKPRNSHALLVNPKQRGNPILKSVCSVTWEYDETIAPDYVMGATTCALFLSVRYHNLNPDYIHDRLKLLGNQYELRVLLVQVDTPDPHHALKHLTRICILANLTLVLAWTPEEAGRILETYKIYEHKPPDLIMERKDSDTHQKIVSALTTVRSINNTDAGTLMSTFGSLKKILQLPRETLSLCPGLGPQKATRLFNVLHQPFLKDANSRAKRKKTS